MIKAARVIVCDGCRAEFREERDSAGEPNIFVRRDEEGHLIDLCPDCVCLYDDDPRERLIQDPGYIMDLRSLQGPGGYTI